MKFSNSWVFLALRTTRTRVARPKPPKGSFQGAGPTDTDIVLSAIRLLGAASITDFHGGY